VQINQSNYIVNWNNGAIRWCIRQISSWSPSIHRRRKRRQQTPQNDLTTVDRSLVPVPQPVSHLILPQFDDESSSSSYTSADTERWSRRLTYSITGRKRAANETIHSVFLATGLFVDADEHMHQLPSRHPDNIKAGLRWFIELCAAGLGMFTNLFDLCQFHSPTRCTDRPKSTFSHRCFYSVLSSNLLCLCAPSP
jgi:hypothetical protein